MKRAVLAAMLAVSLALPGAVQAASPSWNLVGSYTVAFTCTAGCMEVYVNSMTITSSNDTTGAVVGSGSVNGFPGYDWTLTGTVSGSSVTFDIEWVSPPALLIYNPFILTGSIDGSGVMSGTASDGQGRTFDWVTTAGAAVPLPATYFVVTATSPQTVGAPFSFTVTAKDVNGGTVTGYTGAVHFTSTDVAASLPADYTFVGGDAGVHTFTNAATLNTTGGQTITATDTVTSSITGTSGTITVAPLPATYFVVTATSPQTVGAPFSFTVTAKDVNGGTVTGYTGAVHFTSTDVAASLPADYTFVGGDAGVHTFTNAATLNTTGGQTITATDTVTSSITGTSGTITVNAPPKPPSPSPYAVPTITSLSPGAAKVGATVTLTGTSLSYARSVTFNGVPASFSVRTPSLIVATVPAGARTGPVRVTTPFGGATSARSFYVLP